MTTNITSRGIIIITCDGTINVSTYAGVGTGLQAIAEGAAVKMSNDAIIHILSVADGVLKFKRVESSGGYNFKIRVTQLVLG